MPYCRAYVSVADRLPFSYKRVFIFLNNRLTRAKAAHWIALLWLHARPVPKDLVHCSFQQHVQEYLANHLSFCSTSTFPKCSPPSFFSADRMSELRQSPAGEQDGGHNVRNQCFPAALYRQRGSYVCVSGCAGFVETQWKGCRFNAPPVSLRLCALHSGGQLEQRAGEREWRGPLPVRPSSQLHGGGDRERRAVCRHCYRFLRPWPRHIPELGRHATTPDCPVQLQMAEWYRITARSHWRPIWVSFI